MSVGNAFTSHGSPPAGRSTYCIHPLVVGYFALLEGTIHLWALGCILHLPPAWRLQPAPAATVILPPSFNRRTHKVIVP
jgi:hypothetical protein